MSENEESLAHQILIEQKKKKFPGLVKECESFINELKILNPFDVWMSENEWKRMVKSAVSEANSKEIKEEITEKYRKLKKSEEM